MYLLDTNACISYLRASNAGVVQRLQATPIQDVCICSLVRAELMVGTLVTKRPLHHLANLMRFFAPYASLPFDDVAADIYATIRAQLALAKASVGHQDVQIAAIAIAHGAKVVTHNQRDFGKIPGLAMEDWHA